MERHAEESPMDSDWFRQMAEFEASCESTSVGGLAHDLGMRRPMSEEASIAPSALGKLIELARRKKALGLEELSVRAEIDLAELVELERGEPMTVEPRTIYRLCQALELPRAGVMELAGLTRRRDRALDDAAVRFAAQSKSIEKLSKEEKRALEEFVRGLEKARDVR